MIIFPEIGMAETDQEMPEYTEVKWNFKNNRPMYRGGEPVIVHGAEAVYTWALNALQTVRGRYPALSQDYGSEAEKLIGQPYTDEIKRSEAARYITDALTVNPYIKAVVDVQTAFDGSEIKITCTLITVYGEVRIDGIII